MIARPELLLIGAVAAVGVLHTVVPDHWVPITLIARQQGWTKREVGRAALVAGTGHTVSTLLIGVAVWIAGVAFATKFGTLVSTVSSVALIAFGGWIALSSLREMRGGHGHGHGHEHGHRHEPAEGFHGPELERIATEHGTLELSIFETGIPARFRLSGHRGDAANIEIERENGERQRFDLADRGDYWESLEEIAEPHAFAATISVAQGGRVRSYETTFAEHAGHAEHGVHPPESDALYRPAPAGTTVVTKHRHAHRHGHAMTHVHMHDHGADSSHPATADLASDPPHHDHPHKRALRTTLLLILGSSPMVEGIPAFFAAGKYGAGLIAVMSLIFALSTIATYVLLCVASVAGLQRVQFGRFARYGEVLSGAFIALVGLVFLAFPIL